MLQVRSTCDRNILDATSSDAKCLMEGSFPLSPLFFTLNVFVFAFCQLFFFVQFSLRKEENNHMVKSKLSETKDQA